MRRNKRWFPLTPECCKKIKQTGTVTLCIPMIWYEGKETKPEDWKWITTGIDEDSWNTKLYDAEFCPHCGKPVPEIEEANSQRKVCTTSDGNYCNVCKERLRSCTCLHPTYRWKTKRKQK